MRRNREDEKKARPVPPGNAPERRRDEITKIPNIYALISAILDNNSERGLSEYDIKLFLALVEYNNAVRWKPTFRRSYRQLSERSGVPVSKIKKVIGRLVGAGLIEATLGQSGDKTNVGNKTLFRVNIPSYFGEDDDLGSVDEKSTHPDEISVDEKSTHLDRSVDEKSTHLDRVSVDEKSTHLDRVSVDRSVDRSVDPQSTDTLPESLARVGLEGGHYIKTNNIYSLSYIAKLQNFDFYYKDLHREKRKFLSDEIFIRNQQDDFPDIDVKKTLEKAVRDYYSRPAGHLKVLRDCERDGIPPDYHKIFAEAIADHRNHIKRVIDKTRIIPVGNNGSGRSKALPTKEEIINDRVNLR
jgi:hypothetical protein